MKKLDRMYKALGENRQAIKNGGSKFYYTKQNEILSELIAKEESKK